MVLILQMRKLWLSSESLINLPHITKLMTELGFEPTSVRFQSLCL